MSRLRKVQKSKQVKRIHFSNCVSGLNVKLKVDLIQHRAWPWLVYVEIIATNKTMSKLNRSNNTDLAPKMKINLLIRVVFIQGRQWSRRLHQNDIQTSSRWNLQICKCSQIKRYVFTVLQRILLALNNFLYLSYWMENKWLLK